MPELVNRNSSIDGNRADTARANGPSTMVCPDSVMPLSSARRTAARITGFECPNSPAVYSPTRCGAQDRPRRPVRAR